MDPTIIVAILVTVQILYQAWTKYRNEAGKNALASTTLTLEGDISLAGVVDGRIQRILEHQDARIQHLEEHQARLEAELTSAIRLLRRHGIGWPPTDEEA